MKVVRRGYSPVFKCMDGAIRDMANLKGAYKVIDKTEPAIRLILTRLDKLKVKKAVFHFDLPVLNSGRLKTMIGKLPAEYKVETEVFLIAPLWSADKKRVLNEVNRRVLPLVK